MARVGFEERPAPARGRDRAHPRLDSHEKAQTPSRYILISHSIGGSGSAFGHLREKSSSAASCLESIELGRIGAPKKRKGGGSNQPPHAGTRRPAALRRTLTYSAVRQTLTRPHRETTHPSGSAVSPLRRVRGGLGALSVLAGHP